MPQQLRGINRIILTACGTSWHAALYGEYLIEELAGIPVEVQLASEFKYRTEPLSRSTAILAISQSGETADTIAALGNGHIKTPNLDRLTQRGVAFRRAYMMGGLQGATCVPSRAILGARLSVEHCT